MATSQLERTVERFIRIGHITPAFLHDSPALKRTVKDTMKVAMKRHDLQLFVSEQLHLPFNAFRCTTNGFLRRNAVTILVQAIEDYLREHPAEEAEELIKGRPYASRDAFLAKLSQKVSPEELAVAKTYLK